MKTILLISPYWKEEHRWMVSTVKLAELWQRLGCKVVVLCMGDAKKGSIETVSETLQIHRVSDFFIPDPWNYGIAFGLSGQALRLAHALKPDVIVVNKVLFWSSISLLRLRMAGYRVLLTTDALVGITWWPRGTLGKICGAIYAWTLGWAILAAASKIVFFHPQPPTILKRLGIAAKSIVIPTGIDPSPYAKDRAEHASCVVTYVGRLESVKGADDFVAAAIEVKKIRADLTIEVVGWYKKDHPLVSAHQDEVSFTGLRHDIAEILQRTDIFVLPSYSEGLSNALMEAMASGCACIASDVGGNAFLIQNGVSGFLFQSGDREALAAHIRRLAEDPAKRRTLGAAARARIHSAFSWDSVGKQYDAVFSAWSAS